MWSKRLLSSNAGVSIVPMLLPFIFSLSVRGQNWQTTWGQSVSCHPGGVTMDVFTDPHNNIYCGTAYTDTIFYPDTTFIHPATQMGYYSLAKYDPSGRFVKAVDIYSIPAGGIFYVHFVADEAENLYICAEFSIRAFLLDSVINHGPGPYPESPDIFVAKIGPDFKIKWIKMITGPYQDDVWGFRLSPDNYLYLACQHYGNDPPIKKLYILGQDTIQYQKLLNTVIKTDLDGKIQWVRQITGTFGMEGQELEIGSDKNIYYKGFAGDDIYVEWDTILYPPNSHYWESGLMISFTPEGNLHDGRFNDLGFHNFRVNASGQIYFDDYVYDTLFIGNDTLVVRGDTAMWIVGKLDNAMQPIWYHSIKKKSYSSFQMCAIDEKDDSLFFAIPADRTLIFMDSIYNAGYYNRTFIFQLDPSGAIAYQQSFGAEFELLPYSLSLDQCSNIIISGAFSGTVVFGRDTLVSYMPAKQDAFTGSIKRIFNLIDLGNDTTIRKKDTLMFSLSPNYSSYKWSTGDITPAITITGSELGIGDHEITVTVTNEYCSFSDSIKVTVVNTPGISEEKDELYRIFPVPTSGFIRIEIPVNNCEIAILDGQGTEIYKKEHSNVPSTGINLDLSEFKKGIYFIRIKTGDTILVRKLVKI